MFTATTERLKISPKIYPLNLEDSVWIEVNNQVSKVISDDENFPKKFRTGNFFKKPSSRLNDILHSVLDQFPETRDLIWHFEIFNSVNPVGLHNDRNLFLEQNELCEMGMIIPLAINGVPHLTRFYDFFVPKKVNWDGEGHFRTLDKVIYPHSDNAMDTFSDAVWETGKIIFFDSKQIHEAKFPDEKNSFKLSLNGLGYSYYKDPRVEI